MKIEQEIRMFKDIVNHMTNIFAAKRADYGPTTEETFRKFGPVSLLVRMHDKLGRLDNLFTKYGGEGKVKDESVKDTLMDLANYCIIAIIELEKFNIEKCADVKRELDEVRHELDIDKY